ncbi:MAG: 30S ribosomal protein S16 [Alphaproteobacteria bacterium]|jgi:small subunit ribosomal protein S16|nr:30S ribosomal protein S16 [Alphaproteobacteria bacterium]
MLKIRMSRGGTKKRPFYKIVVADARCPRDGRFIERLGHYNPLLPKDNVERVKFDLDRMKYWLSQGAQPSDRIERFLADVGLAKKKTSFNDPSKSAPRKKAQERLAAEKKDAEAAA